MIQDDYYPNQVSLNVTAATWPRCQTKPAEHPNIETILALPLAFCLPPWQ